MELYFILVKPGVPGNIGSAARAIKTMGFKRLRLVTPAEYLGQEARMMAFASGDILENAEVFDGLEQAISDLDLTVATTAKTRDARVEYIDGSALPALIRTKGKAVQKIGLVFGREESGLTNDEIRMCDMVSSIPLKAPYPSLNLGQSVMLYAYIMASFEVADHDPAEPSINEEGFRAMMDKSEKLLRELDIDGNPALFHRIQERLAALGEDDIHLVHSILNRLLK